MWKAGLIAICVLPCLAACKERPCPPCDSAVQGGAPTPSGQAGVDPLEAFRRELADPRRHDLRSGGDIDMDALLEALRSFAASHGDLLDDRFNDTLGALATGEPPGPPTHSRYLAASAEVLTSLAMKAWLVQIINPDVEDLVRSVLQSALTTSLISEALMSHTEVGGWMTYLLMAEPIWSLCGRSDDEASVCLDFGGLDVLMVRLVRGRTDWIPPELSTESEIARRAWIPDAVEWWKKSSPSPDHFSGQRTGTVRQSTLSKASITARAFSGVYFSMESSSLGDV